MHDLLDIKKMGKERNFYKLRRVKKTGVEIIIRSAYVHNLLSEKIYILYTHVKSEELSDGRPKNKINFWVLINTLCF